MNCLYFAILLASSFLLLIQANEFDDQIAIQETCIQNTHVDRNVVERTKNGEFSLNDDKLKAFFLCVMKKMHFIDNTGKIDKNAFRKYNENVLKFTGDRLNKIMDCAVEESTPELTAFHLVQCKC